MAVITKEIMENTQETVFAEDLTGLYEMTENELVKIAGGGDKNHWCNCYNSKPTGRVFKRWIIEGLVYYRDVELQCPDCGEISYRSKMF